MPSGTGVQNLQSQRPLRLPDGRWDMALWLDRRGLERSRHWLDQVEVRARQAGIPVCGSALDLASTPAHTIFVVGHNPDLKHPLESPGLLKELRDLGKAWQGRFIILFSCGQEYRQEIEILTRETGSVGIYYFWRIIFTSLLPEVFNALVDQSLARPGLLPGEAMGLAVHRVVDEAK